MSDVGRYRLIFPRLWRHPGFRSLSPSSRMLALYLLCGGQANRIGLFYFSPAVAAEDLKASVETIRKGLADVAGTFGWVFDSSAGVLYIPSWWRWNKPANANVLTGNLKDLHEIPPCALVDAFAQNFETLPETLHQTFIEGLRQRLHQRSPTQDQYQDLVQEQEHSRRAPRGKGSKEGGLHAVSPPTDDDRTNKLLAIARETLKYSSPNGDIEELSDAFRFVNSNHRQKVSEPTRQEIATALGHALLEHRKAATA